MWCQYIFQIYHDKWTSLLSSLWTYRRHISYVAYVLYGTYSMSRTDPGNLRLLTSNEPLYEIFCSPESGPHHTAHIMVHTVWIIRFYMHVGVHINGNFGKSWRFPWPAFATKLLWIRNQIETTHRYNLYRKSVDFILYQWPYSI